MALVVVAGLWIATVWVPPFFLIPLVWFAVVRLHGHRGRWRASHRW